MCNDFRPVAKCAAGKIATAATQKHIIERTYHAASTQQKMRKQTDRPNCEKTSLEVRSAVFKFYLILL